MVQFKLLLDILSSSDWARIQLTNPGTAVGLATDRAMRPVADPDEIFIFGLPKILYRSFVLQYIIWVLTVNVSMSQLSM